MKKVLVVSGSPRKKGNTVGMAKILEEKMTALDSDVAFDYMFLHEQDLKFCLGCMNCLKHGGDKCPLKDDAASILKAMKEADGLVFLSPAYGHQVSALFKNFLDRFMYQAHLPELVGVPTVVMTTAGYDGAKKVPKYICDWNLMWWGFDVLAQLGVAHVMFELNEEYRRGVVDRIGEIARDFLDAMREKKLKTPTLRQYFYFLFNRMETEFCETGLPARYRFWKERGWLTGDYYYETGVSPIKKLIGRSLLWFMENQARKNLGRDYKDKLEKYY